MTRGRLITIEGLDGAGKTTLAVELAAELSAQGVDVRLLREPGGVAVAERIRDLVKDPELQVTPRTEALLYAAARAQLVEEAVEPLLASGTWVLLDRFVDSSLAYQGRGRELGVEEIRAINLFGTGGLQADRTLLLVVDSALGRSRSRTRAEPIDRLESEREDFFDRVGAAYLELAAKDPERIRMIDGSASPDEVRDAALTELSDLL